MKPRGVLFGSDQGQTNCQFNEGSYRGWGYQGGVTVVKTSNLAIISVTNYNRVMVFSARSVKQQ
jgi:hypothetical protein